MTIKRCPWATTDPAYLAYHDCEWGVPVHGDRELFEMLTLEGAQAGLSWSTILKKRESYRRAFDNFDIRKVACYDSRKIRILMNNPGIVRNRLKIESAVSNAKAILAVQGECGSFDAFIWKFVNGKTIGKWKKRLKEIPALTAESEIMSRELKKRGFRFVGPTICYAYMQAVGMVNDHIKGCFRYKEVGQRPYSIDG